MGTEIRDTDEFKQETMNQVKLMKTTSFWLFLIYSASFSGLLTAASALVNDNVVKGNIAVGAINSHIFTANAGDAVHIRVVDLNNDDFSPNIWLYNPDGTVLGNNSDRTTAVLNCNNQRRCKLKHSGTYRLLVESNNNISLGSYEIHYKRIPGSNENGSLVNDGIVKGDITVGDMDSYVFSANAEDAVHIRVVDLNNDDFSPNIWLYNPDGTVLGNNSDSTTAVLNCNNQRRCKLEYSGTYRLLVESSNNTSLGSYKIHYLRIPSSNENNSAIEGNSATKKAEENSSQDAAEISPIIPVDGAVSNSTKDSTSAAPLNFEKPKIPEPLVAYNNDLQAINLVADYADYAVLAWAAYGDPDALAIAKERGWTPAPQPIVNKNLLEGDTVATLFVSDRGKHAVAFRGTKTKIGDNLSNLGTFDFTPLTNRQSDGARKIAEEMVAAYPEVVFVGHSLGGRLAQVARLHTGNAAAQFNSAPLSNYDNIKSLKSIGDAKASLASFRNPFDRLTKAFPGHDINVKNISSPNHDHNMGVLARAMQDVRLAREQSK